MKKGKKALSKSTPVEIKQKAQNRLVYGILIILSFLLYGQTMSYDYTLDDSIVIKKNEFTKKGVAGIGDILTNDTFVGFFGKKKNLVAGGRYRPLSLVTFAIEVQMFGMKPGFSHFINILLYALTAILLYKLLLRLLKRFKPKKWYFSIPFIATILFIAHPVHTEVVANIKGRDEIMTLLGSLLALWYTLNYLDSKKIKYLLYSFIAFFLAFMSKENTVTFLAIIPLSVYFFTEHKLKDNLFSMIPLLAATLIFLGIRQNILGSFSAPVANELLNNPFLDASKSEKFATIFYTLLLYIKLLIFPHPLTYDYYPKQIPIINWSDIRAWGSLAIYSLMGIYALIGFKKKSIISYSIIFYIATLSVVSNLVFPVGTFMNERFIFISSIGFTLIIAYLLSEKLQILIKNYKSYSYALSSILLIVMMLYSVKSISRNRAWKDDYTLFTTDTETSVNSAKGNAAVAALYREKAESAILPAERNKYWKLCIQHFTKALEVYPKYFDVSLDLAVSYYKYNKDLDKSAEYIKKAWAINSSNPKVMQFVNAIFGEAKAPRKKLALLLELDKLKPGKYSIIYNIGSLYGKEFNNLTKAVEYLEKAVKINPKGTEALKDLGVAYGMLKQYKKSVDISLRAIQLDPRDAQVYFNLGVNYRNLGDSEKSKLYFNKAAKLDPKYKQAVN